jgi:hypothetical protein
VSKQKLLWLQRNYISDYIQANGMFPHFFHPETLRKNVELQSIQSFPNLKKKTYLLPLNGK